MRENDRRKVAALAFGGDAMEETLDKLCAGAGEPDALRQNPDILHSECLSRRVSFGRPLPDSL